MSRICFVAWTSSGTVAYSHFAMARSLSRAVEAGGRALLEYPVGASEPRSLAGPRIATLRSRRVRGLWAAPMAMGCPGSVAMVRARLHVVSGKGGTGKTTVAAALAIALASHGHRTLLCEVEGRQGIAQLFDLPPLSYKERKIAIAPGRGEVFGLAIDAEAALLEYLDLFYKLGRAGRTLDRIGAIDFATTVAPGMRDVLLTGKAYEATRRRDKRRQYVYDAVVLDAPPTGRISRFLNVNTEVAGLARMGPIHRHAVSIMRFLKSPSTAVHLVTLLEEMPVQEAADGRAELTANGLHVGAVFVNMVREPLLPAKEIKQAMAGKLDRKTVAAGLTAAGLSPVDAFVDALLLDASDHAQRIALEQSERKALVELGRPIFELPRLADGVDLGGLYALASRLGGVAEAA